MLQAVNCFLSDETVFLQVALDGSERQIIHLATNFNALYIYIGLYIYIYLNAMLLYLRYKYKYPPASFI